MKKTKTRLRVNLIRFGIIALFAGVLGRIVYVQAHDRFIGTLENQEWQAETSIMPQRGTIYDAGGDKLAFSVPAYDMDIDLALLQTLPQDQLRSLSDQLATITGASKNYMWSQLTRKDISWLRMYPYLVHVSYQVKTKVLTLFQRFQMSNAINPYHTYKRIYPSGTFAAHVIGFLDQTGNGAAGIEMEYNNYLAGKPGTQTFTQDNTGSPIPLHPIVTKPVENGDSVYLTIDPAIESYADQALSQIESRFHPSHAAVIVADPQTGAILAMAALPFFNPNDYWNYSASTLDTNWAISDPFEPGSTFKVVTLTGALASHSIKLNQTYMSGVDYVNGVPIYDWNLYGWGRISYDKAMIYSSNVGFIHIGQAEGVHTLYHYIDLFGLNQPTGIDLPGESSSIIFPEQNLNPVDFATMTFGQGLAITPIQQIAEVGAVANGGKLLRPYLVQKIISPSGKVILNRKPEVVRQVASPAIMKEITNVMVQDVADNPYETNAYIPGYDVAGKTGTAQIPDPKGGYYQNRYNLSFIGFVPANHPQLEIYVTVNEPHNTIQYGNSVSSPAAQMILVKSLAYLHIPPNHRAQQVMPTTGNVQYVSMPKVTGMPMNEAQKILERTGLHPVLMGPLGNVVKEWPNAGTQLAIGSNATLASVSQVTTAGTVKVPNLRGLSMSDAINACAVLGLQVSPDGSGYAIKQSVKSGTSVPLGTVIQVQFAPH